MDFNTGSGGGAGTGGSSQGPGGPPPRVSGGASGGEFNYQDPVQSFINTVRNVVTAPVAFFRSIPRQGNLLNPVIFAIICYEVSAILGGLLSLTGLYSSQGFGSFLVSIILAPIFAAIGLFIGAGILHLLVMLIIGSGNAGFESTLRVSAYSSVTSLVSWIPIIGWIASLYGIYLAIVGMREVHSTTTGKAALVVLIPAAVVLILVVILIFAVGALFYFGTQQ
ncbi:MAG TPA: YIP1 family protein [Rubrobacter sp.]|nr:YIP1 family protein [Rubrobacter sp.]